MSESSPGRGREKWTSLSLTFLARTRMMERSIRTQSLVGRERNAYAFCVVRNGQDGVIHLPRCVRSRLRLSFLGFVSSSWLILSLSFQLTYFYCLEEHFSPPNFSSSFSLKSSTNTQSQPFLLQALSSGIRLVRPAELTYLLHRDLERPHLSSGAYY
jgi:hypothetical protein